MVIDRELEALDLRGLYAENSPYLPPESLQDTEIRPAYTNPMMRLQKSGEAEGIMRIMEVDTQRQQMGKPSKLDDNKAFDRLAEAFGAPMDIVKTADEYEAEQQAATDRQTQQDSIGAMQGLASAAKDGLEPMQEIANAV